MRPSTCGLKSSYNRAQRAKVLELMACIMVSELYLTEINCEDENGTFSRGGKKKGKRRNTTMRNFEILTIPQGSLKPDLPSLESVVTAQHRCWALGLTS